MAGLLCCFLARFVYVAANRVQASRSVILILEPLIDMTPGEDSTMASLHDNESANEVSFGDDD